MSNPAHSGVYEIDPKQLSVPAGATNAIFLDGLSVAGCNIVLVENRSGTTLGFMKYSGVTLTPTQIVSNISSGDYGVFLAGLGYAFEGPTKICLFSQGATLAAQVVYGKSQGT